MANEVTHDVLRTSEASSQHRIGANEQHGRDDTCTDLALVEVRAGKTAEPHQFISQEQMGVASRSMLPRGLHGGAAERATTVYARGAAVEQRVPVRQPQRVRYTAQTTIR